MHWMFSTDLFWRTWLVLKVLIIEPPFDRFIGQRCEWFPIGLTSIASFLEINGHVAKVYNAEHDNSLRYINTGAYLRNYHKYREGLRNEKNVIWDEVAKVVKEFRPDIVGISVKSIKVPSALKIAGICKNNFLLLNNNGYLLPSGRY